MYENMVDFAIDLKKAKNSSALLVVKNRTAREDLKHGLRAFGVTQFMAYSSIEAYEQDLSEVEEGREVDLAFVEIQENVAHTIKLVKNLKSPSCYQVKHIYLIYRSQSISSVLALKDLGFSGFLKSSLNVNDLNQFLSKRLLRFSQFKLNHSLLYIDSVADFLQSQGRYKEAIEVYKRLINQIPDEAHTHYLLGQLYGFDGQSSECIKSFRQAVELNQEYKKLVKKYLIQNQLTGVESTKSISQASIDLFNRSEPPIPGQLFYRAKEIKSILIVGGKLSDRINLKSVLLNQGLKQITLAPNEENLESNLQSSKDDIVIFPIELAEINGLDLLKRISHIHKTKKIMILPQHFSANLEKAFELGLDAAIFVPYNANDINRTLHDLMVQDDLCCESTGIKGLLRGAYHLNKLGLHEAALRLASKAHRENSHDALANAYLGIELFWAGQYLKSRAFMEEAQKLNTRLKPITKPFLEKMNHIKKQDASQRSKNYDAQTASIDLLHLEIEEQSFDKSSLIDDSKQSRQATYYIEPEVKGSKNEPNKIQAHEQEHELVNLDALSIESDEGVYRSKTYVTLESLVEEHTKQIKSADLLSVDRSAIKLTRKGIENSLSLGSSPINLPHTDDREQIASRHQSTLTLKNKTKITTSSSQVKSWIPPEELKAIILNLDKNKHLILEFATEAVLQEELLDDLNTLLDQINIINARIVCIPDDQTTSPKLARYLESYGEIPTLEDFIATMHSKISPFPDKYQQLLKKASTHFDPKLFRSLGRSLITSSEAERYSLLFAQSIQKFRESCSQNKPFNKISVKRINLLLRIIELIDESVLNCHAEIYQGKKDFESELEDSSLSTDSLTVESSTQQIFARAQKDLFSFSAFKKLYCKIKGEGNQDVMDVILDKFYTQCYKGSCYEAPLVDFLITISEQKRAASLLEKLIKNGISINRDMYLIKLSMIYVQTKQFEHVIRICKLMLEQKLSQEQAYNMIAVAYKKLGNLKTAIAYYKKGTLQFPNSYKLHFNLSIAYAQLGMKKESKESQLVAERLKAKAKPQQAS